MCVGQKTARRISSVFPPHSSWGRTLSLPGLAASAAEPSHQACFLLVCVLIVHWRYSAMTGFYFVSVAAKRCSQFHAGSTYCDNETLFAASCGLSQSLLHSCLLCTALGLCETPSSLPGYPGVPQLFSHSTWTQCHRFPRNYRLSLLVGTTGFIFRLSLL